MKWIRGVGIFILGLVVLIAIIFVFVNTERKDLDEQIRSRAEGSFIKLSRGWVHYQLGGAEDGRTVVLVHGFSVPYYVWEPTYQSLVENGYRVLRFDLYGRGYSDRPRVAYDLDLFTNQLQELLAALALDDPVDVIGLSMGGPVVVRYAVDHPQHVRSVILISPLTRPASSKEIFPMNLPLVGEVLMAVYVEPFLLPEIQKDDFYRPDRYPDWEDRYRVQLQYRGFRRAILSTMRHLVDIDPVQDLKSLDELGIPVLLIWGEEDRSVSREEMEEVRSILTDLEYHSIPQAGHLSHYERPIRVNSLLVDFLKRAVPSPGKVP